MVNLINSLGVSVCVCVVVLVVGVFPTTYHGDEAAAAAAAAAAETVSRGVYLPVHLPVIGPPSPTSSFFFFFFFLFFLRLVDPLVYFIVFLSDVYLNSFSFFFSFMLCILTFSSVECVRVFTPRPAEQKKKSEQNPVVPK